MYIKPLENVQFKVVNPLFSEFALKTYGQIAPKPSTDGSAGYDLIACIKDPIVLKPLSTVQIGLGFQLYIAQPEWASFILPRSGLGTKHGIVLANTIGLIDSDYQGEWGLRIFNRNDPNDPQFSEGYTINPGERIAQMTFLPVGHPMITVVDNFSDRTVRGDGAYGSTGKA